MIDKIGQLFITGFEGETPSEDFLKFFTSEKIGGLVLFEEQCNPHSRAENTIRKLSINSEILPIVAVDQEGGRICRFKGAPAEFGDASEYGKNNNLELYSEQFSRATYYLQSLGINLLFGPVADLQLGHDNICLEGRTFGSNPARVIPFIERTIKIAHKVGLLTCVKHFPGFGAASVDPHKELSRAGYNYQTFINREALTFQAALEFGSDMVMTTHLLVPDIDSKPATISKVVVEILLRGTLAFDGLVITDDLTMLGAGRLGGYGERALRAFKAGHDLLLFGRDYRAAGEALEYFRKAYEKGQVNEERLRTSLERVSGIKSKLAVSAL